MMNWLQQRAPREQLVLGIAALLVVILIGWAFVWKPLESRSVELENNVDELASLLVDLRRAASLTRTGGGLSAAARGDSLLTLVPDTASEYGLRLDSTRIEQNGNAMAVTFSDLPFDTLHSWLTDLALNHALSVQTVPGISSAGVPGLVRGQVRLVRR
jgi:type II secretory pathway component PulM